MGRCAPRAAWYLCGVNAEMTNPLMVSSSVTFSKITFTLWDASTSTSLTTATGGATVLAPDVDSRISGWG